MLSAHIRPEARPATFAWASSRLDEATMSAMLTTIRPSAWRPAGVGDPAADDLSQTPQRDSRRAWMQPIDTSGTFPVQTLVTALAQLNGEHFGFDVWGLDTDDYPIWQRYDDADAGAVGWHFDAGPGEPYRKISFSIQCTDPAEYSGGLLEFDDLPTPPSERGTLVAFPSYLRHRVTPVTAGSRLAMVGWVQGPPFR